MRLYEPLSADFYRYCRSRAIGIMDTDDLVNDAVLAVYERFTKIENEGAFKAYLYKTAGNIASNALRRKKFSKDDPFAELKLLAGDNPELLTDYLIVSKTILKLPEVQKEALMLFEVSGFSIAEICDIQKASESAVKQRLRRGRASLKSMLEDSGVDKRQKEVIMSIFL